MKIYLIDSENTGKRWIKTIHGGNDEAFWVFYSQNSSSYTNEEFDYVLSNVKNLRFERTSTGQHALDFELIYRLGWLTHTDKAKKHEYFVVSADKGYDGVIEKIKKEGYSATRIDPPPILSTDNPPPPEPPAPKGSKETAVEKPKEVKEEAIKKEKPLYPATAMAYNMVASRYGVSVANTLWIERMNTQKTKKKPDLFSFLEKNYGSKNGTDIYSWMKNKNINQNIFA